MSYGLLGCLCSCHSICSLRSSNEVFLSFQISIMCSRGIKLTGFASGALGVGFVDFVSMLSLFNIVAKVSGLIGSGALALSGAASSLACSVFTIVSS